MADVRAHVDEHPAGRDEAQYKAGHCLFVGRAEGVVVAGRDFPPDSVSLGYHAAILKGPAADMIPGKARRLREAGASGLLLCAGAGLRLTFGGPALIDIEVALHVFMAVLVIGTLWRVLSYHAMASPNVHLQHVGMAMATQY